LPLKLEGKTITKKILITDKEKQLAKSKLRKVAKARAIQKSKQRRRTWKHRYLCEDRFWLPASFDVVFPKEEPETSLPDDSLASVSCPYCDLFANLGERCPSCLGMGFLNLYEV